MPNLSAVKKQNQPLRGLAFKEAKQRIMHQSNEICGENQAITPSRCIKIESDKKSLSSGKLDAVVSNFPHLGDANNKPTYKEMLRGIKKGVTVNNQSLRSLSDEKLETKKLISNLVTTNRNLNTRLESNKVDKNGKPIPVRMQKTKNYIKILKIKGDKIATVEKSPFSNLKDANLLNKNLISSKYKNNLTFNDSSISNDNTVNTSNNQDYQNVDSLNANSRLFSISINNFTQSILNGKRINSSPNPSPDQC